MRQAFTGLMNEFCACVSCGGNALRDKLSALWSL